MLDPAEALARILDACTALPDEKVPSSAAMGRVLTTPVTSPATLPPFHNSAMDGFALAGGNDPLPAGSEYPIEGEQAAGDERRTASNGAWEIMTGARLPEGLDRVIPVEQAERLDGPPRVRILADVPRGENIREAGSDVPAGEQVIEPGTVLAPQHLMLLTALGVPRVRVAPRPKAAVLCTGRELVDDPAQTLQSGQIRNSNGPFLAERLPRAGAELVHAETLGDEGRLFLDAFERARGAGARVVVSTGAVSMGRYDFVPQALERLGAEVLFHKLAIRPGKPLLVARLADGTLFFGLPGNPIATAVSLRFFVEPALRVMMGLPPEEPWRIPLAESWSAKRPLRYHLKSRLDVDGAGRLSVTVLPGQESYRIRPLANANAWVVVPIGAGQLSAGSCVEVYGLGHLESPAIGGSPA
ncbi:MAG: molybdopterin molybdotransferase MoeA [Gammaproteobacteria bacterium]|nr:molybdopterin molybdotransferase MoeA [Gammaproteobacteria bacterium]